MSSVVPASFLNVTESTYLQSFLSSGSGTTETTTGGILGVLQAKGGVSTANSALGVLQSATGSGASATALALSTGGIKSSQQKVLAAIGSAPDGTLIQQWNANGSEPSTLANLRSYGWITLTGKSYDASAKTSVGSYQLTAVGYAIYQRTGGGSVASGGLSASSLNGTSSATSSASSQTAAVASILSSLGFTTSSVAALAGGSSSSSSSSSSSNGSLVNLIA
jgi:hypothetical protein